MAGMEQIEVHSKSYLVRWIRVTEGNTISWSLQPQKKSINFGVFKHPGQSSGGPASTIPIRNTGDKLSNEHTEIDTVQNTLSTATSTLTRRLSNTNQKNDSATVTEKLQKLGMKCVAWSGRCEADRVSLGHYDVKMGESGMYGLVFDNTHSKQLSKTVTFVLMTYPTSVPPKSGHHLRFTVPRTSSNLSTTSKTSPRLLPVSDSSDSLPQETDATKSVLADPRPKKSGTTDFDQSSGPSFYTGVLSKKRRKKNQGYARRFFSLDFTTSTLSYYRNRTSSALRGAIPLTLAVVAADEKSRHISIDSGAEIWLLRAHNQKDFEEWKDGLERASQTASGTTTPGPGLGEKRQSILSSADQARDWETIESLVGKVGGIAGAVRRLAQDTDPKYAPTAGTKEGSSPNSALNSPIEAEEGDYFQMDDVPGSRKSFWKRSPSTSGGSPSTVFRRTFSSSGQKGQPSSLSIPSPSIATPHGSRRQTAPHLHTPDEQIHNRCMGVLRDLNWVVAEFSSLIKESRQRRMLDRPTPVSRTSIDSMEGSEEFFDAEEGTRSQILRIDHDSDGEERPERDASPEVGDSELSSDEEGETGFDRTARAGQPSFFGPKPKSLKPLPKDHVKRRTTIPPSSGAPPSLISFLRKNVGKDLSTIAMPVTSNEPLSLLQRQSEQFEYSELLDTAVNAPSDTGERLLYIAAFAISSLSNSRLKERAIRKPFNPMLGETFELVREDKGFRYISEKISHRPVRIACQAESKHWTFTHAPSPTQKFWGKSAELITEGRARLVLHAEGDCYSWTTPTCFLRNIIAGEKYVEPVQNMTVIDETSGRKAVATFKAGGMFSGRSEDVSVEVFDAHGQQLHASLEGKWTTHLTLTPGGKEIWKVGPLVQSAATRYGMTAFSATLNEITPLEANGAIPPTDSRLRPDQKAYEEGDVHKAESMKASLEEAQRRRRKEMETAGEKWEPKWFEIVGTDGDEEVWMLRGSGGGAKGYWDVREAVVGFKGGKWDGIHEIFQME